jgi:hypothetical protein
MTLVLMGLGTLVTAIAALFTILEMRHHRRVLYKPEFICESPEFLVWRSEDAQALSSYMLAAPAAGKPDAVAADNRLSLVCRNIGLGPAKHVSYKWSFDAQRMVESLAQHGADVSRMWIEDNTLKIDGTGVSRWHNLFAQAAGFSSVVHSGPSNNSLSVSIPSAYLELFTMSLATRRPPHETMLIHEPLNLELSYRDLEQRSHLRRFKLIPQLDMISYKGDDSTTTRLREARGRFDVREE